MLIKRHTVQSLQDRKGREPLVALTAYDHPSAVVADQSGVDLILVGDSVGPVVLGHVNTLPVTEDDMVHHARAVARGAHRALVVADLPFMADRSRDRALEVAGRLMKEALVQAVKLEGANPPQIAAIEALVHHGIPVVGHLGFTPQHLHQFGGFKVQGKTPEAADRILEQARRLEQTGVGLLVLELVPEDLAARVTSELAIPTIGIGAGPHCDGQIQVFHDLLGLHVGHVPRHARRYLDGGNLFSQAIARYARDVRNGTFFDTEAPGYVRQD
ncbi:MAG: 3-methyl-2-oxobutanoate hydroxymethyltransferase [bacterium]|nr:3-methyl-2-oxobutanoate hydroxymethyltransferase [bacterium]